MKTKWKILQFTDLHFYDDKAKEDHDGIKLIEDMLMRVRPDLVILTGDIIDGPKIKSSAHALKTIVKPMIDHKIMWTYLPGNHDDESPYVTRSDLFEVMMSLPYCFVGSEKITNFDCSIELGPIQLFLLDSNAYDVHGKGKKTLYDWIHKEQIEWYKSVPVKGEIGLSFYHIPVPEFKVSKILKGYKGEEVCCPEYNSGFFEAAKEKGDIQAMIVGHDHLNDYVSELEGIWLVYGRVSGYTEPAYYANLEHLTTIKRGCRVVEYNSENKELSTWIENYEHTETDSFISKKFTRNAK